jgi:hypothetical protein
VVIITLDIFCKGAWQIHETKTNISQEKLDQIGTVYLVKLPNSKLLPADVKEVQAIEIKWPQPSIVFF